MRIIRQWAAVLAVAATASCCRVPTAASGLHAIDKPVWTTDLKNAGFAGDEFDIPAEFEAVRQIAFGSDGELVVASASGPFAKPNTVHAFVLDTGDGKIVGRAAWVSNSWPFLFATAKGEYAVVTAAGMALYSPGLKQVAASVPDVAADKASPDGAYLAASKTIPGHGLIYFIDAASLKPTGTEIRDTYAWSVGDNRILATGARSGKAVVISDDGHSAPTEYQSDCGDTRPQFVAQDLIALLGCGRVGVISASGTVVFSEPLAGAPAYLAVASRNGRRFAVLQHFEGPGDPPTTCEERVTVFDVVLRRSIFLIDVPDLKGFNVGHSSGIALSPDGSFLAVNSAGLVRLFSLPAS
jgi:hypothetical protein